MDISLAARIHPREPLIRASHRKQADNLYKAFGKRVNLTKTDLDMRLFRKCVNEACASWVGSRSMATIIKSFQAAPVDWDPKFAKLFLKSQRVKKLEKATADASKGQIVTDIAHLDLFRDDVWALYLEKMLLKRKNANVYLHTKANPTVMDQWYQQHWKPGRVNTACDYQGWDGGVDEAFILFYGKVLNTFGVPISVVERIRESQFSRTSFRGPIGGMQHSGNRFTWIFNTMGDIAVTEEHFPGSYVEPSAFSGDDSELNGYFEFRPAPVPYNMVSKVLHGYQLEFCGFMYGGERLHISSRVLLHRFNLAIEDGRSDPDFWLSARQALAFGADSGVEILDDSYSAALGVLLWAEKKFNITPHPDYPLPVIRD